MVEPLKDTRISHPNQSSNTPGEAMHSVDNLFARMSLSQQGGHHGAPAQQGYPPNMAGHRHSASMPQHHGTAPSLGGGAMPIGMEPGPQYHGHAQNFANSQQHMRNMSNVGIPQHQQQRAHSIGMPEVFSPDIQNFHNQNYTGQQQVLPQQSYGRNKSMSPPMTAAMGQYDPVAYPVHDMHTMPQFPQPIGRPRAPRRATFAGYPHDLAYLDEDSDDEYAEFGMLPRPHLVHRGSLPNPVPPQMMDFPQGQRSIVPNPAMAVGAPVAGPITTPALQIQLTQRGLNVFERPYGVSSGYIPGQSMAYPTLTQDISVLRSIFQPMDVKFKNLDTRTLINILVPKSPYEIDALRHGYRQYTGQDLGTLLKERLVRTDSHILYGFLGMALGLLNFDIWLTRHDNVCLH